MTATSPFLAPRGTGSRYFVPHVGTRSATLPRPAASKNVVQYYAYVLTADAQLRTHPT